MAESFIVILERDDPQIINAIKQIEGVIDVKPVQVAIALETIKVKTRLWEKIDQIFEDELKDEGGG